MDKKKLGIIPVLVVIAFVFALISSDNSIDDTNTIIPQGFNSNKQRINWNGN